MQRLKVSGAVRLIYKSLGFKRLTDPFRPNLFASSKIFQVVFIHIICNSALSWASCCSSFLLVVVANLICIFRSLSSHAQTTGRQTWLSYLAQTKLPRNFFALHTLLSLLVPTVLTIYDTRWLICIKLGARIMPQRATPVLVIFHYHYKKPTCLPREPLKNYDPSDT